MSQLSAADEKAYTEAFKKMDENKNGVLEKNELARLCEELGFNFNHAQLQVIYLNLISWCIMRQAQWV